MAKKATKWSQHLLDFDASEPALISSNTGPTSYTNPWTITTKSIGGATGARTSWSTRTRPSSSTTDHTHPTG